MRDLDRLAFRMIVTCKQLYCLRDQTNIGQFEYLNIMFEVSVNIIVSNTKIFIS